MAKFFNTITKPITDKELKDIYESYTRIARDRGDHIMSFNKFLKTPNINIYVDMKCLNCHFEVREHFGDYAMEMEAYGSPFPIDWCPKCGLNQMVPKDIYNKLNT